MTDVGDISISVVIPARNRADVVARAVRSALGQTRAPSEVIVVDDASEDDTGAVARAAGASVLRRPEAQGSGFARNAGIRAATSEWIAFLDSDDLWLPDHLARAADHLGSGVLVAAPAVDTEGRGRGLPGIGLVELSSAACFIPESPIVTSGVVARRDALMAAGLFRAFERAQDGDMWARLLEHGRGVALPEPTVVYSARPRGQASVALDRAWLDAVMASLSTRPWMSRRVRTGVRARYHWDDLTSSVARRDPAALARSAAWLGVHPATWSMLSGLLAARRRNRDPRWAALLDAVPDDRTHATRDTGPTPTSAPRGVTEE